MKASSTILKVLVMILGCVIHGGVGNATAPTPDPATFSEIPDLVLDLDNECHMTATEGSDAHTPILYYFEETNNE